MAFYVKRQVNDSEVLLALRPEASFGIVGNEIEFDGSGNMVNVQWMNSDIQKPTKQQILDERVRQQEQLDATEYQRQRYPEYPPLSDLADAIYWQQNGDETKMTAYLAAVEAVKQKYPKGE